MPDWALYDPQLRQFHADGVTPAETARRLNLPPQTVRDRLIKLGLLTTRPKTKKSPPQEEPMPDNVVEVLPGQISLDDGDAGGVSAVADIIPVNEISEPLSLAEVQSLEHYEQIIAQGFKTFVQVGQALVAIRDQRLYRQSYGTFEEYLRQRWDLSRPYAYQLMDASQVVQNLSAGADIVAMHGQSSTDDIVPVNEAQARPLASLPLEQQREVWKEAVETAPPSGITAKHVQATVKRVKEQTSTTTPSTTLRRGQAEETRERMGERGQPNSSWINVLSHCNRLCSSLVRLPDLDDILESWGPEGRQKAIDYLRPLYGNVQQLLWSLKAIDAGLYVTVEPQTSVQDRDETTQAKEEGNP